MTELVSLLPNNATATELALEQVTARASTIDVPIADLWSIDTCPASHLPWLAWALSVDLWDANWSEDVRREVLRNSVAIHRKKGTVGSVKAALAAINMPAELEEWFETGGDPHTFRLTAFAQDLDEVGITIGPEMLDLVTRAIDPVKPVRSQYELRVGEEFSETIQLRAGMKETACDETTVYPSARPTEIDGACSARSGVKEETVHAISLDLSSRPSVVGTAFVTRAGIVDRAEFTAEHFFNRRDLDGDVATGPFGATSRANLSKRIQQLAWFHWTPLLDVPGARARYPEALPAGTERLGPPYSSVKLFGYTVGQDVLIETFLSAAANPDSVLYGIDLFDIAPTGRAFYGAVCSNFLAYGFGWPYSPTTTILSRDWADWGFLAEIKNFTFEDVEPGDLVITDGGGHIEYVDAITPLSVTLFDQSFDGPERTQRTRSEFMQYAAGRNYKLLKYDFDSNVINYYPNRFSPLPGEYDDVPPPNPVLLTQRGNKANYAIGETVRFNVLDESAQRLIVMRDNAVLSDVALAGVGVVARSFTQAGDYRAFCIMDDGSESSVEQFKIASVSAQASQRVVTTNSPVTVQFSAQNCVVENLILESGDLGSISSGILREISPQEVADGQVTFSHTKSGEYNIRLRATNAFGAVFTTPVALMPLTVLD